MTFKNLLPLLKSGEIGMLPNFEGYIKWSYIDNKVIVELFSGEIQNNIEDSFKDRTDFYYIT